MDEELLVKNRRMWDSFIGKPECFIFDMVGELKIPDNKRVYFYNERNKRLYWTTFKEVCDYVDSLEPWEEIDAYVFEQGMDWILAVTHEDRKTIYLESGK